MDILIVFGYTRALENFFKDALIRKGVEKYMNSVEIGRNRIQLVMAGTNIRGNRYDVIIKDSSLLKGDQSVENMKWLNEILPLHLKPAIPIKE